MQQKIKMPAPALLRQNAQRVVIGIARMDADRQAGQAGGPYLTAERLLLHVARRAIIEIIQPGLADTNHARM